jgi:hypothetical protein
VFGAKAQPASFLGDFCNKIGTKQTYKDVYCLVRFRGEADVHGPWLCPPWSRMTRSRHLTPGAASRPSSGERDKIVLAHPLQDQKYG